MPGALLEGVRFPLICSNRRDVVEMEELDSRFWEEISDILEVADSSVSGCDSSAGERIMRALLYVVERSASTCLGRESHANQGLTR